MPVCAWPTTQQNLDWNQSCQSGTGHRTECALKVGKSPCKRWHEALLQWAVQSGKTGERQRNRSNWNNRVFSVDIQAAGDVRRSPGILAE